MNRYRLMLLVITASMLLTPVVAYSQITSVLTFPNINPNGLFQYAPFYMRQGWYNDDQVWFTCTDTSDYITAYSTTVPKCVTATYANGITFAPKLISAAGHVPLLYVIRNVNQGPVFTTVPGESNYAGVWQVVYVTYNPGVKKHIVSNADPFDAATNPTGLPSASDATYVDTNNAGLPIIVKYPVMAVGPLGGPWYPIPINLPLGNPSYRIPQGRVLSNYAYTKIIWLPFWYIYCADKVCQKVTLRRIIVPDVFDPDMTPYPLLAKTGANSAPGLADIPVSDQQTLYWQVNAIPMNQYPILQACPSGYLYQCRNTNYDYTPIDYITVMTRNSPPLPITTVINNEKTLLQFEALGFLSELITGQIIDAPVLPESVIIGPDGRPIQP